MFDAKPPASRSLAPNRLSLDLLLYSKKAHHTTHFHCGKVVFLGSRLSALGSRHNTRVTVRVHRHSPLSQGALALPQIDRPAERASCCFHRETAAVDRRRRRYRLRSCEREEVPVGAAAGSCVKALRPVGLGGILGGVQAAGLAGGRQRTARHDCLTHGHREGLHVQLVLVRYLFIIRKPRK